MVFKKEDIYSKVCNALKSLLKDDPITEALKLHPESDLLKQILQKIDDKRFLYASVFLRFLKRNETILRNSLTGSAKMYTDHSTDEIIKRYFSVHKIRYEDIRSLRLKENGLYKDLARLLHMKDSFHNRLRIYKLCKMYFSNINISSNQVIVKESTFSENNLVFNDPIIHADNVHAPEPMNENNTLNDFTPSEPIILQEVRQSTPALVEYETEPNFNLSPIKSESVRHKAQSSSPSDIIQTSPERIDLPRLLLNLSNNESDEVLPKGAQNVSVLGSPKKFAECNFLEGCVNVEERYIPLIMKNGVLTEYFSYFCKNRIARFVNNVCIIVVKYKKYLKNGSVKLYAVCKHNNCKKFKIIFKSSQLLIYSSSRDYCHKQKLTSHIRGVERSLLKTVMIGKQPSAYRKETILTAKKSLISSGNLQNIKSDSTIRKIRSEAIAHLDRDKDDIIDLIMMQREHQEYIKEVAVPFSVKLYSKEQLFLLQKQIDNCLPVIYFDATGSIVRKPSDDVKRVYLYSAVIPITQTKRVAPVFEMISAEHFAKNIFKIFHDFRVFCEENNRWPAFASVVTDFSFANIHAISKACNRIELLDYLKLSYKIACKYVTLSETTLVTIHLCCAHFMKMVAKDVKEHFSDASQALFMKNVIAQCIQMKSLSDISQWFFNMSVILKSKHYDSNVQSAFDKLTNKSKETNDDTIFMNLKYAEQETTFHKNLYQESPFYKHFESLLVNVVFNTTYNDNPYYNEAFFRILLTKYMPYCPLWSGLLIRDEYNKNRFSNTYVENYFGHLKANILKLEKNLKPSRFVRKSRENLLSLYKEVEMNIGKTIQPRQQKADPHSEVCSQEEWKKKARRMSTYFSGSYLKNVNNEALKIPETKEIKDEDDIFDIEKCLYCCAGRLDITTEWVQCDSCQRWAHQRCESPTNRSYSGEYICRLCTNRVIINKEKEIKDSDKLRDLCTKFLCDLGSHSHLNRSVIQEKTKLQRDCDEWFVERRKRLTSSNFGRICKSRNEKSKNKIVTDLLESKDLGHIKAIKYGIQMENVAISTYLKQTKGNLTTSGLVVHKDFPFLGASPDGLIDEDGVIEIKCPQKAKSSRISDARLEYLDINGNLKITHDYYYQIQGILEITNRPWCDFVIYTEKDMKIQRIYRSAKFWRNMFWKLKEFYYFYYLPKLVFPHMEITDDLRRWTTIKTIKCLPNGLVDDIAYYKKVERDYCVAIFDDFSCVVRELRQSDYESLTGRNWLSGFAVTILMNIVNKENQTFQVIDEVFSTKIFTEDSFSNYFLQNIRIKGNQIAMPLLVNNNHFCLCIIQFNVNTFSFIDPMGSNRHKSEVYLRKFSNFLRQYNNYYNESLSCDGMIIKNPEHILQEDDYNCGPFIIYFFEQICKKEPLTVYRDMAHHRIYMKQKILYGSSAVNERCLMCSSSCTKTCVQCLACLRFIHPDCLRSGNTDFIRYDMCDICRLY